MQVGITPEERAALIAVTTGRGRTKWFTKKAKISYTPLAKLKRAGGTADDDVVKKVRAALQSKEAQKLIKEVEMSAA